MLELCCSAGGAEALRSAAPMLTASTPQAAAAVCQPSERLLSQRQPQVSGLNVGLILCLCPPPASKGSGWVGEVWEASAGCLASCTSRAVQKDTLICYNIVTTVRRLLDRDSTRCSTDTQFRQRLPRRTSYGYSPYAPPTPSPRPPRPSGSIPRKPCAEGPRSTQHPRVQL